MLVIGGPNRRSGRTGKCRRIKLFAARGVGLSNQSISKSILTTKNIDN